MEDDLTSRIYEAAVIPQRWLGVLAALAEPVDADGQAIVSISSAGETRHLTSPSYEAAYRKFAAAGSKYHNVRPDRAIARRHYGFLPDVDLCTEEELDADPIYRECLRPNGMMWTIGSLIPSPSMDIAFFDFARRLGTDPFGPRDVLFLDSYRPQLARAALLATRLGILRATAMLAPLSLLGLPGAVVTDRLKVIAANSEFEQLAPRLRLGADDQLWVSGQASAERLRSIVGRDAEQHGGSVPFSATEEGEHPLIVHVLPIKREAHDIFAAGSHLLIGTLVTSPAAPLAGLIEGLFDLTPAEARLARGLSQGIELSGYATDAQISIETARTHLKHIMQKTGTRRQADLMSLLAATTTLNTSTRRP